MPSDESGGRDPLRMVEVYRASVTDARDTLAMLRAAGLSPMQVGSDDPIVDYASAYSQRVTIVVPPGEVEEARRLLAERDHRRAPAVREASRQFTGMVIVSTLVALGSAVVWFWLEGWGGRCCNEPRRYLQARSLSLPSGCGSPGAIRLDRPTMRKTDRPVDGPRREAVAVLVDKRTVRTPIRNRI